MPELLEKLDNLGIISIMDLDDYWAPGKHHPAYHIIKANGLDKKILDNIKIARNVMTTTPLFAEEIKKYNKNVFVIPNAVDPKEKQYIPNLEKSDRLRIGWLGGSCMTPDTEILTNEGWKRFDELNQNETVATLNPKTNELEYHKPTGYICEPFDGELNCAKNGLIEYEVTPNHNMYASVAKSLTHKKLNLGLIQSEKIHGKNFHIKKDGIWKGEEKEFFTLPMLNEYHEIEENQSFIDRLISKKRYNGLSDKYGNDRELKMDDWLEFFGFWMAEGWTCKTKGLHQVGIAQSKENGYLEYMYNLLTEMGFNPKYTKDKKQIRVFDKQLWEYLSNFGNAYDKFIPEEILGLSSRQLKIFLEWFIKGDGHIEKNKYSRTRAYTCSPSLANNLQEIALKIGVSATITNRGKRTSKIKNREINNQFDSLVINFTKDPSVSKHNKNTPLIKTEHQYNRYYKGNVYCVEVENHIIYVRRNGKPMWIGNSHKKDLEILNGVVSKLKGDKLLDKLQFVLCGFDTRGTHTQIDPKTGQQTVRNITPKESVWFEYEKIFTDNYSIVSDEYKNFLMKFTQEEYPNVNNEPYRRVWTKPISTYATNYNLFDISLAPLEENIFNNCKCIVGDSLISTSNGFKHISDIVDYKTKLQTEVCGVKNNVINYFKYENVDTVKITTLDGYNIEGTPHHKIFIGGKWIELKNLKIGDFIELTKPEFLQTQYQEITYPMLLTKNITQAKIDNSDDDMLPRIRINENWGRLLGYLLGDGNYNGNSQISISCDKRHIEVVEDVVNLFKSIGLNPLIYDKKIDKRCKTSLSKEGNAVDVKSTCINFLSISKKYGWCGQNGKTFRIPKVILESPKSVIREFLKGLFEADGTVNKNGIVSFCSKDIKLVEQVQILLLGFGIQSTIKYSYNKHYRKYYYNLNLRREGSEIFGEEIGFISKNKIERLSLLKTSKRSNNFIKQEMTNEITKIEFLKNTVYDIEVDVVHEYNANGIKNHNSQLKVIEAGFHKKAIIAQDFGPYQLDLTNAIKFGGGFDETANGILIESRKNHKDWYTAIKKLTQNPEIITVLQENLHNTVKNLYSLEKVSEQRKELYLKLTNIKKPELWLEKTT
jgi:intein/homing endonuclease